MPVKKSSRFILYSFGCFLYCKMGIYHYEMPASGVAEGYSKG